MRIILGRIFLASIPFIVLAILGVQFFGPENFYQDIWTGITFQGNYPEKNPVIGSSSGIMMGILLLLGTIGSALWIAYVSGGNADRIFKRMF